MLLLDRISLSNNSISDCVSPIISHPNLQFLLLLTFYSLGPLYNKLNLLF